MIEMLIILCQLQLEENHTKNTTTKSHLTSQPCMIMLQKILMILLKLPKCWQIWKKTKFKLLFCFIVKAQLWIVSTAVQAGTKEEFMQDKKCFKPTMEVPYLTRNSPYSPNDTEHESSHVSRWMLTKALESTLQVYL